MTPAHDKSHAARKHRAHLVRIEDLTRREFMFSAFGAALLIACGSDEDAPPEEADPTSTAAPTTRMVTDAAGNQIEVPNRPERPLALSEPDLDAALALGLQPVGTLNGRGQTAPPRYLKDRLDGVEVIGQFIEPDLEQAVLLQPDIVLAGGFPTEDIFPQLREIAATVVTFTLGEGWKAHVNRVAEILNRQAEADAFFAAYEKRLEEVRANIGDRVNATVSVTRWNPQGPGYMLDDSFAAQVLSDIGLQRPEAQHQPGVGHSPLLSMEQISLIDADWLFLGTLSPEGDAVVALESAQTNPLFRQLGAVQAGRVVPIDGSQWTSLGGPLAAMAILDDVEKALKAG